MRRVAFFFLAFCTFYAAAMYRSFPLMLLALTDVFLVIGMRFLTRHLKNCFMIEFPEQVIVKEQSFVYECGCRLVNMGKLPVCRFRIDWCIHYSQETGRSRKHVSGIAETGISEISFQVHAPYCGMICLETEQVRVYDYLSLFSGKKPVYGKIRLAILPPVQSLQIELTGMEWDRSSPETERAVPYVGDMHSEIRQIREYHTGDSCRQIHWNLSARTGHIWVKEYEKETDLRVDLLLEINMRHWIKPEDMDAFYRILSAIVLGFLKKTDVVQVYWFDAAKNELAEIDIYEGRQCPDLFLDLYQADFSESKNVMIKKGLEEYRMTHGHYFRLDSGLCWYQNEHLIYQFSRDNLNQEIADKVFAL